MNSNTKIDRNHHPWRGSEYGGRKHFLKMFTASLFLMLMYSCGTWGWESIETDNEEKLNIFGVISLDDSLQSFIIVHKTLDTAGPDELEVGRDTVYYQVWDYYDYDLEETVVDTYWYDPPWIRTVYESRYLVKDATVTVSDGVQDYSFVRGPENISHVFDSGLSNDFYDPAMYLNLDGSFRPLPDTDYTLEITTEQGLQVTGAVHTPPIPEIKEALLPDTVSIRNLFNLEWHYRGNYVTSVTTDYIDNYHDQYICGLDSRSTLEAGDTTWVSSFPTWCFEEFDYSDPDAVTRMAIRVRFIDENYDRYFLSTGEVATISNILLGEGGIAEGYGIDGGFGVFGAVSADWSNRLARP